MVVIGSNAGGAREPAWVGNLRARPRAQVRIRRELRAVVAFEAAGEERERLWALVVEGYPGCALYAQRATRRIPVVVLEAARDAWPTPLPRRAVAGASIAHSPTGSGYGVAVGGASSVTCRPRARSACRSVSQTGADPTSLGDPNTSSRP